MLNKPSPRLAILRAQLAAEADAIRIQRASYKISNAVGCSCPVPAPDADSLPLPPDYWSDLEHWLKTLAPAKPAAEQPAKSQDASGWRRGPRVPYGERLGLWHVRAVADDKDVSNASDAVRLGFVTGCEYRPAVSGAAVGDPYDESKYTSAAQHPEPTADVWHSEAPSVAGVYQCLTDVLHVGEWYSHYDGQSWSGLSARSSGLSKADHRNRIVTKTCKWLRLIEADKPAQQPAQKASTHSVCIKARKSHGFNRDIGTVLPLPPHCMSRPEYWLPCDESGWVTHVPTADAVCPVPDGMKYQARLANGEIGVHCGWTDKPHPERRIIAWRPIAQS